MCFVLFVLILYVPSTIFQLYRDGSSDWVEPVLSSDKGVLLKDHNAVKPVRLEPAHCVWGSVFGPCFVIHYCVSFEFCKHLDGEES